MNVLVCQKPPGRSAEQAERPRIRDIVLSFATTERSRPWPATTGLPRKSSETHPSRARWALDLRKAWTAPDGRRSARNRPEGQRWRTWYAPINSSRRHRTRDGGRYAREGSRTNSVHVLLVLVFPHVRVRGVKQRREAGGLRRVAVLRCELIGGPLPVRPDASRIEQPEVLSPRDLDGPAEQLNIVLVAGYRVLGFDHARTDITVPHPHDAAARMDVFHAVVQMRSPIAREEEPPQAGWEPRSEPLLGCDQSFLPSGGFTQPRLNPLPSTQSPQLNLVQKICPLLDRSPRMADTIDGTLSAGDRTGTSHPLRPRIPLRAHSRRPLPRENRRPTRTRHRGTNRAPQCRHHQAEPQPDEAAFDDPAVFAQSGAMEAARRAIAGAMRRCRT
ncbi:hypothetical protein M2436_007285 [Streptomyces sp. HB372]|nr:hypothetical protein [Streptomyces sp. HB372]